MNNDIDIIREISNITGVKYSDEQLEILKHRGGKCILASAGSGKTTVLTHLIAKMVKSGEIDDVEKLLCTTYSKSGQQEMSDRIKVILNKLGINKDIQVKTLHASYLEVLRYFGLNANIIGSKDSNGRVCGNRQSFIMDACKDAGIVASDEELQLVDSLLSYQVNNMLSDEQLVKSYVYTLENVPLEVYSKIRMGYSNRKEEIGVIDFDDMQLYMYYLLVKERREDVIKYCRSKWTSFFIDEFQDVSKIQFAILRELVTDPNKLIVIGDDDQCIYQWRGADPNIILNICGYYDIKRFVLSTNYRCGREIVRHAATGIINNSRRADKTMEAYNDGGIIKICDTGMGDLYDISKLAYKHIINVLDRGEFNINDIAVLSRNNQHLCILNNMLFRQGIYCTTFPEMRLINNYVYKDVVNILSIVNDTYNKNLVSQVLWRLCVYLGTRGAKLISDFMDGTGCSLVNALGYILTKYYYNNNISWSGTIKVPDKVNEKMVILCNSLKRESVNMLGDIYNVLSSKGDEVEKIKTLFSFYLGSTDFMLSSKDKVRTVKGILKYVKDLIDEMGLEDTKSFLRLTEQFESGNMVVTGPKITMSTMHGSKGREWAHVILLADDNITFPSFEGIEKMMTDGIKSGDISGSIDENRRLHYVAMTRAKKNLTVFADKSNLSVYLVEALGLMSKGEYVNNEHIIRMALNGCLDDYLIRRINNEIFCDGSKYVYIVS